MIKCENIQCIHHTNKNRCGTNATIGLNASCKNFEKGFYYYFFAFQSAMKNSNFIIYLSLTDDVRYSIYYLMRCLPIVFAENNRINGITIQHATTKKILNADDILNLIQTDLDGDKITKCIQEFQENGVPLIQTDHEKKHTIEKEFGWLSTTGDFTESPWGEHESSALEISEKKFHDEYREWMKEHIESPSKHSGLARDFLIHKKGYALIHDPTTMSGYIVQHQKRLTKRMREFLYAYFIDMNMQSKAESYLND